MQRHTTHMDQLHMACTYNYYVNSEPLARIELTTMAVLLPIEAILRFHQPIQLLQERNSNGLRMD